VSVIITREQLRAAMAAADLDEICENWGSGGFEQLVDVVFYWQHRASTQPAAKPVAESTAIEHLRDRLTEPDDPPGLREIAAAVVELADMLRARRPA